ncbi:C45 family autoproteolytic acyltransferase/hydolase [Pseudochrobactrum asaccharolyticum]|uniref:Acyl-CoA:6-aminopenicillanic acid acyl transferase n=1 Tax=Pseudochrobactrum asaccharolyticum TaxID=354351 RepID=A0A366E2E8_9HYPH|nr:C45 family peptidase [Pseudochrobactrum asaccharolyticum]RBO95694.1 acyl-CoA:6-aminopenicillanic acid acyl transferase [Pseudochrobactrum asaccharolyticum]
MTIEPFPFVALTGEAYERGRQYGVLLKSRITRSAELYTGTLTGFGLSSAQKSKLIDDCAAKITEFEPLYLEEMRGISDGSGVAFEDIVMINARTEVVAMARTMTGAPEEDDLDDGCTGALIMPERSKTGNLVHGQNWDWRAECAETGVVLRVQREDGPDYVTFVEAGGLARSGFNEAGITITANYLECDRDYKKLGVPLGLLRRKVLEQEHFAKAIKTVATTPKSCSNNIMIASAAGFGIDFECAPDEAFPLYPENDLIVHANHWVSPVALSKLVDTGRPYVAESFYRDWRVRKILEQQGEKLDRQALKTALFDDFLTPFAVCRPPRPSDTSNLTATVAMVIMEAALNFMEIAPLPALNRTFTSYTLRNDTPVPADAGKPAQAVSIKG